MSLSLLRRAWLGDTQNPRDLFVYENHPKDSPPPDRHGNNLFGILYNQFDTNRVFQ
jgi:hypothetical protein